MGDVAKRHIAYRRPRPVGTMGIVLRQPRLGDVRVSLGVCQVYTRAGWVKREGR